MNPTLGGAAVFGVACKVQHIPNPASVQTDAIFGVSGVFQIVGGTRGRTFRVSGLLIGNDVSEVAAAEAVLLSYADGIARDFTDTIGRTFPNVVFNGEYMPDPNGPRPIIGGWGLPYSLTLTGLS